MHGTGQGTDPLRQEIATARMAEFVQQDMADFFRVQPVQQGARHPDLRMQYPDQRGRFQRVRDP